MQSACASRIRADYIITRNMKDFAGSRVTAINPSELFERLLTESMARMPGSASITENIMNNAKEMKDLARKTKQY